MRTHFFIVCLEYRCGVKNERIRILHNVNQYDRTLARNSWRVPGKGALAVMCILDIFVDFLDHAQSRGNSRVQVEHIGIYLMSVLLLDRFHAIPQRLRGELGFVAALHTMNTCGFSISLLIHIAIFQKRYINLSEYIFHIPYLEYMLYKTSLGGSARLKCQGA